MADLLSDPGTPAATAGDLVLHELDCPRCHRRVVAHFHGPCEDCRSELRAAVAGTARDVEAVAYEPKMNVTPNAVATKD